jgi:hypothetical protein
MRRALPLLLTASLLAFLPAPRASTRSFAAGPGVFVAAGGAAASGEFDALASVGQPVLGVATDEAWGLWTGILYWFAPVSAIEIAHAAPALAPAATPLEIEAAVTSGRPVDTVTLHYRQGGQSAYASLTMTDQGEATWDAMIPSGGVTLRGIEYYIEATAAGRTAYSPAVNPTARPHRVPVQVTDSDGDGALATLTKTYRMISFPADLEDGAALTLLEDDLGEPDSTAWRCGAWEAAAERYLEAGHDAMAPFSPGRAAWLITDRARSIDFTGQTVFPTGDDGYAITLEPGWNQIGDPFAYDVALEDVQVNDGTVMRSFAQAVAAGLLEAQPLHAYDGTAYQTIDDVLSPWTGYFIANLGEGALDLVVPDREAVEVRGRAIASAPPAVTPEWMLRVYAHAGAGSSATVELGSAAEASEGWDCWDRLQPPAPPRAATAAHLLNGSTPARLAALQRDIRPPRDPGAVWTLAMTMESREGLQLSWESPKGLPAGYGARLIDLEQETWVDMLQASTYAVPRAGPGVLGFRVAVGTAAWLAEQTGSAASIGEHFTASLCGGSPHRGGMQVRLVLRRPERVRVEVFDIHGRLVETLVDGALGAGVHAIPWDGSAHSGHPAPAGVYFLRVAGTDRETRLRAVLLR